MKKRKIDDSLAIYRQKNLLGEQLLPPHLVTKPLLFTSVIYTQKSQRGKNITRTT